MIHSHRQDIWSKAYGARPAPLRYIPLEKRKGIHITDLSAYAGGCRRRWHLSSPLRLNLQPAVLPPPLQLGQAIHIGMEAGYRNSLPRPLLLPAQLQPPPPRPVQLVPMNFELAHAAAAYYEAMDTRRKQAIERTGPMWPDQQEEFNAIEKQGAAILTHYSLWAPFYDKAYRLLALEHKFRLPLPGCRDICYEGRIDGIVEDAQGRLYVLEFKTAKSAKPKAMAGTYRSIQATMYVWAAQQLYPDRQVHGVLYRVMSKKRLDIPKLTQQGKFSRAKTQSMTVQWAKYCLDKMARRKVGPEADKDTYTATRKLFYTWAQELLHMLSARENEFFVSKLIPRPASVIESALRSVIAIGQEMANPRTLALTLPVTGFHCSWCPFVDPCDLMELGYPKEAYAVLDAEYARRDYWEPTETGRV